MIIGKKGFTLIELLIVVAIIAILAAIAVPNFLEAQTRAKVSRVKADQRSVATAVEAYIVDNSVAPIGYEECATGGGQIPAWSAGNYWGILSAPPANADEYERVTGRVYAQITTPISYITAIPKDPFYKQSATSVKSKLNDYDRWGRITAPANPFLTASQNASAQGLSWTLISYGPNQERLAPNLKPGVIQGMKTPGNDAGVNGLYDPTNGTVSYGWIIRSNKGIPSRMPNG